MQNFIILYNVVFNVYSTYRCGLVNKSNQRNQINQMFYLTFSFFPLIFGLKTQKE